MRNGIFSIILLAVLCGPAFAYADEAPTPGTVGDARLMLGYVADRGLELKGTQPTIIGGETASNLMSNDCPASGEGAPFDYFSELQDFAIYDSLRDGRTIGVRLDTDTTTVIFLDFSQDPELIDIMNGSDSATIFTGIGDCAVGEAGGSSSSSSGWIGVYGYGCTTCDVSTSGGCSLCMIAYPDPLEGDNIYLADLTPGDPLPNWQY